MNPNKVQAYEELGRKECYHKPVISLMSKNFKNDVPIVDRLLSDA